MTDVSVPHTLTNGTEADASQVNANFAALVTFLNTTGVTAYQALSVTAAAIANGTITAAKCAADIATQAELDAHVNNSTAAHAAAAISITDAAGDFTATNVEGALAEIQTDIESLVAGGVTNGSITAAKLGLQGIARIDNIGVASDYAGTVVFESNTAVIDAGTSNGSAAMTTKLTGRYMVAIAMTGMTANTGNIGTIKVKKISPSTSYPGATCGWFNLTGGNLALSGTTPFESSCDIITCTANDVYQLEFSGNGSCNWTMIYLGTAS